MRMQLPNRELATTDAENASVFSPHLHRVFNNQSPIDLTVLEKIKQREVVEELDKPISWSEIKKAIKMWANKKAPGLNDVLTNAFKALNDANLFWIMLLYNQFWHSQDELDKWNEVQLVHVLKKAIPPTLTSG